MFACINGWTSVVKSLVANAANIKQVDRFKRNALHYAVRLNHVPMIKYLIEQGIDVDQIDVVGDDPLKIAHRNQL